MPDPSHIHIASDFFSQAGAMRELYEERVGPARGHPKSRFVWDYWYVPDQYNYIRTFAKDFFPADLYAKFSQQLRAWGRDHLGCDQIVSPWLSYYVSGCRQELHADVPHGPWAYVFSLTDWERRAFSGGETVLFRPERLHYWQSHDDEQCPEMSSLVELIPPRFNQLTVFDPRIPHGVRTVEGTQDPLAARVVIHGWFMEPELILSDSLRESVYAALFQVILQKLRACLQEFTGTAGLLTVRVEIKPGVAPAITVLSNTLVATQGIEDEPIRVLARIFDFLDSANLTSMPEQAWAIFPVRLPIAHKT